MSARWTIVCACLALAGAAAQEPDAGIQPLLSAGDASYMLGDYNAARVSFAAAWGLVSSGAATDPARYDVLKRLSRVSAASGDLHEADRYLQMAIAWREATFGPDDPKLPGDLLEAFALCRNLKDYDRAMALLRRVLTLDTAAGGPDSKPVADDYSRMAELYMDQKMADSAVGPLNLALAIRTKLASPMDVTLLPDFDRLAEAYIALREYDNAEYIYRRALVIRESAYGKMNADLIATIDGLAWACFGQQKYDQAEPIIAASSICGCSRWAPPTRWSPSLSTKSRSFTRSRRNTIRPKKPWTGPTPFVRARWQPALNLGPTGSGNRAKPAPPKPCSNAP